MVAIADKFGKASISTGYATATTVKTARTAGVSVLETFDLSKFSADTPVFFVTYKKQTDPVTGITSIVSQTSWKALVNPDNNTLTNLQLAPGYTDIGNAVGDFVECIPTSFWGNSLIDGISVSINPDGMLKASAVKTALGNDGNLVDSLNDITSDFVLTGGVWSLVSGFNGTMTALTAYINGYKNTMAAVTSRVFTPSKDTYVDVLKNSTTHVFTLVYTEVANNAAPPALAANSMRLARIVTSGAAITLVVQYGVDSSLNRIYPTKPISSNTIDWTTVRDTPGQPIKLANISFGYAMFADISRIGNMVFVNMNTVTSSSVGQIDSLALGETVPLGYRPAINGANIFGGAVVGGSGTRMGWHVATNGSMQLSNTTATSGGMRVIATGSWITGDAFPA